jgi:hypothetical protein
MHQFQNIYLLISRKRGGNERLDEKLDEKLDERLMSSQRCRWDSLSHLSCTATLHGLKCPSFAHHLRL